MRHLTTLTLGMLFLTLPLAAQTLTPRAASGYSGPPITARQATPDEMGYVGYINVPSPMLLDISLGTYGYFKSLKDMSLNSVWSTGETAAFVCDDASLESVQITKVHYPWRYELTVRPTIKPEIPGRIIGLTVAIVSNGQELQRQTRNVSTRGALRPGGVIQARSGPGPEFHFQFTEEEFVSRFDQGQAGSGSRAQGGTGTMTTACWLNTGRCSRRKASNRERSASRSPIRTATMPVTIHSSRGSSLAGSGSGFRCSPTISEEGARWARIAPKEGRYAS